MTHTSHREGDVESLKNDFVFVVTGAKGFNKKGCAPRVRKIMEILAEHGPVNLGDMETGNTARGLTVEEITRNIMDSAISQAVFTSKEKAIEALKALKEADLGISITISGLNEEVKDIVQKASVGDQPHTVNLSLGFMGKTEKAPPDDIRQITTMCGHAMVAAGITEKLIEAVKRGWTTPEEAGLKLARQCTCGAFNPQRAASLIRMFAGIG
ncbi:MAG: hypothetical protein ACE5GD_05915 [Candidatus Geothermarchaeales archaeon]